MALFLIPCGVMPTTAALVPIATGTTIKTLLQVKPFNLAKIVEWGISFDGNTPNPPGKVELIETDIAATVTAFVDADITKLNSVADVALPSVVGLSLGTTATGYGSGGAEGATTAIRHLDPPIFLPPTGPFVKQFPLGREPAIQKNMFARIRVTFSVTVNAYPYMIVEI